MRIECCASPAPTVRAISLHLIPPSCPFHPGIGTFRCNLIFAAAGPHHYRRGRPGRRELTQVVAESTEGERKQAKRSFHTNIHVKAGSPPFRSGRTPGGVRGNREEFMLDVNSKYSGWTVYIRACRHLTGGVYAICVRVMRPPVHGGRPLPCAWLISRVRRLPTFIPVLLHGDNFPRLSVAHTVLPVLPVFSKH